MEKTQENQRNAKINEYIRRQAVIKSKFPEIDTAPKSIQDEYYALVSLISSLQTSRREIWGQKISSDGYAIDGFVKQKYEEALAKFSELNNQNVAYITKEEEDSFEFPKIDFDALREEVKGMKTTTDFRVLFSKLAKLRWEPLPEETEAIISELIEEMAQISKDGKLVEEETTKQEEKTALVNESKFAQIYGKAKGKIQQVFSNIKSFFKVQSNEKNNENQDKEAR